MPQRARPHNELNRLVSPSGLKRHRYDQSSEINGEEPGNIASLQSGQKRFNDFALFGECGRELRRRGRGKPNDDQTHRAAEHHSFGRTELSRATSSSLVGRFVKRSKLDRGTGNETRASRCFAESPPPAPPRY